MHNYCLHVLRSVNDWNSRGICKIYPLVRMVQSLPLKLETDPGGQTCTPVAFHLGNIASFVQISEVLHHVNTVDSIYVPLCPFKHPITLAVRRQSQHLRSVIIKRPAHIKISMPYPSSPTPDPFKISSAAFSLSNSFSSNVGCRATLSISASNSV
jgi:hypothetical protein